MSVACVRDYLERLTALELHVLHITSATLDDYQHYLETRPNRRRGGHLAPRTVQIHLNAVRALYAFLERSGMLDVNPASCLKVPRAADYERSALRLADIERLRAAAHGPVERALLAVFYGCGLRRSEAEQLTVRDVDLHGGLLHVRRGKGGRPRTVPMSEGVMRALTPVVCLARRHGEDALFVNRQGRRMQAGTMYRRVKQMAVRAELASVVTLHGLRHAVATHLLEAGLTLEQVQVFLGHGTIESTRHYTHIAPSEPEP